MKTTDYKRKIADKLKEILIKDKKVLASTHFATIFSDYTTLLTLDGIADKEIYLILDKYFCEMELDTKIPHSSDIEKIIKDAQNLTIESLYGSEDEDEDY